MNHNFLHLNIIRVETILSSERVRRRTLSCAILLATLCSTLSLQADSPAEEQQDESASFRYCRTGVRQAESVGKSYYAIDFDDVFYRTIDDLQSDLRVRNADLSADDNSRRMIPFLVEREVGRTVLTRELAVPGKIVDFKTLPDNRAAVDFELAEGVEEISAIEIVTPEKNFEKRITIQLGDGANWSDAVTGQPFFDYSDKINLSSRRFNFEKPLRGRIVRLIIENYQEVHPDTETLVREGANDLNRYEERMVRQQGLKIDAIRAYRTQSYTVDDAPLLQKYTLTPQENYLQDNGKVSVYLFRSDRNPLTRSEITSSSAFYQRRVTLYASENGTVWSVISGGTIRKLDSDVLQKLEFPETRNRFYKLEVYNGDDAPLENLTISVQGVKYRILLAGRDAAEQVQIFYGGKAPRGEYDLGFYLSTVRNETPGHYQIGAESDNERFASPARPAMGYRWLLTVFLVVLALALLFYLGKNLSRIEKELPDDER